MTARHRIIARRAALLALAALASACAPSLKVMTYNVRYAADDGPQPWPSRRPAAVAMLRHVHPDVIGTQELLQRQGDDIVTALPAYRWFGRDRMGGHANEHMGILYRADRLTLRRQGDFWLSDTPEVVGSQSWGTDLPRMATWGEFELKRDPSRRFLLVNTHLPHRDVDAVARDRAAAVLLARIPTIAPGLPVVLTGDFNTTPDSDAYRRLAASMHDAWSDRPGGETFHDFTGVAEKRIDYIFLDGARARGTTVVTERPGGVWPSDHFPVVAKLTFLR
ncbi:endonuclease/exonuclease/phosphatase family protein [Sphingomonas sp. DT-51]|uniref:endonuclease/exonuclease/phosphatase family protein n=1 Tax=Sphingomonas sp. DT-51 TaxID=3396165 RepID=UPI003F195916